MTKTQAHENRVQALLTMPEMAVKVLFGRVVHRGVGLNWRVGGALDGPYLGPEQAAERLARSWVLTGY